MDQKLGLTSAMQAQDPQDDQQAPGSGCPGGQQIRQQAAELDTRVGQEIAQVAAESESLKGQQNGQQRCQTAVSGSLGRQRIGQRIWQQTAGMRAQVVWYTISELSRRGSRSSVTRQEDEVRDEQQAGGHETLVCPADGYDGNQPGWESASDRSYCSGTNSSLDQP